MVPATRSISLWAFGLHPCCWYVAAAAPFVIPVCLVKRGQGLRRPQSAGAGVAGEGAALQRAWGSGRAIRSHLTFCLLEHFLNSVTPPPPDPQPPHRHHQLAQLAPPSIPLRSAFRTFFCFELFSVKHGVTPVCRKQSSSRMPMMQCWLLQLVCPEREKKTIQLRRAVCVC